MASEPSEASGDAGDAPSACPAIVAEEEKLLGVVLAQIDASEKRTRVQVDDAQRLIELRDALAEAKPEDQGALLEQMHRVEALARQRGKGENAPLDRRSPYFGHLRLLESGRRRDVLIGQRGYVEPGGGIQIVDWRNAPVSRLYYRYEEGDSYEEVFGERVVEGEIAARRTLTIQDAELRRVVAPQGTFARDPRTGAWTESDTRRARLSIGRDGSVAVLDPDEAPPAPRQGPAREAARLRNDGGAARGPERFLPAIAALIDPRQFELISRPASGLIVVQGSAGSGKTTIGLHRIAYLAFADPERFRPSRMLVVVYQRALATYVSRVLPHLDVPDVPVVTFSAWAAAARRQAFPDLDVPTTDATPAVVMRAKSHRAMLAILADRQRALADECRAAIADTLEDGAERAVALAAWDAAKGPLAGRVAALAGQAPALALSPAARAALGNVLGRLRARAEDVIGEWAALLTDRRGLAAGFARHAPGLFSDGQIETIWRWCNERERLRVRDPDDRDEDDTYALDAEDDALLLRLHQLHRGPLPGPRGQPLAYEHLMVDEVQDFAPLELAVLLDATTPLRSVTLAGDTAQAIDPEHGFSSWTEMLEELDIAHDRVEPLRVSYRSTREIVEAATHVLGPLREGQAPVTPRSGAPVESFGFATPGEAAEFLARSLKELMLDEPATSVALIARHPEQARLYHEALAAAEVPHLRLVANQDFSFRPGVDVTDVRQTKGLEFDIVILLEANDTSYPEIDHARRLLHVAMTRAAHQLWITYTGRPSRLLP